MLWDMQPGDKELRQSLQVEAVFLQEPETLASEKAPAGQGDFRARLKKAIQ